MNDDLTNLLPPEREQLLSRDYALRLGVVVVWFVTALTLVAGALLLPTFLLLTENVSARQAHLTGIESALSSTDESSFAARLDALNAGATTISALARAPSASGMLRQALAVPRSGVTLSALSYTPAAGGGAGTLTITGAAATRDALRAYQNALSTSSFAHSVDLPVSAYAKDTDIPFLITVTLKP